MTYTLVGFGALVICALVSGTWFAFRSGRNAARVRSEAKAAAASNTEAAASQRALNARTNGIRDENELSEALDKGDF